MRASGADHVFEATPQVCATGLRIPRREFAAPSDQSGRAQNCCVPSSGPDSFFAGWEDEDQGSLRSTRFAAVAEGQVSELPRPRRRLVLVSGDRTSVKRLSFNLGPHHPPFQSERRRNKLHLVPTPTALVPQVIWNVMRMVHSPMETRKCSAFEMVPPVRPSVAELFSHCGSLMRSVLSRGDHSAWQQSWRWKRFSMEWNAGVSCNKNEGGSRSSCSCCSPHDVPEISTRWTHPEGKVVAAGQWRDLIVDSKCEGGSDSEASQTPSG